MTDTQVEQFDHTAADISRESGAGVETVRAYGDAGWIACRRLINGVRVFPKSAIAETKKVLARRLANRGRRAG